MKTFALLLAVATLPAFAADPTKPPEAWLAPQSTDDAQPATGLRLQSVLIPQHGRPLAIIGGRTVELGGRLGDQRLVRLNEREAVLQGADGITHLYLTPEVEKRMVAPPKSRPARKAEKAKDLP